jgi:hypothetical protein
MRRFLDALTLTFALLASGYAQQPAGGTLPNPKESQAYEMLSIRKAEAEAELRGLRGRYSNRYEGVARKRFEISALEREMDRMAVVEPSRAHALTADHAYLVLRKVALEVELLGLRRQNSPRHPHTARVKSELDALGREIERRLW